MTFTKARFASFEEYLTAEVSDLPEGLYEYWDGELVPVMAESWVMVGTLMGDRYQFKTFREDETIVSPSFLRIDFTAAQILKAQR